MWVYNPHTGGVKISPSVQDRVRQRILAYAEKHYKGKYSRIDVRFRGALCYIDAYLEPVGTDEWPTKGSGETREQHLERMRTTPMHLCRLRHFTEDRWSLAFYTYSHETYEPATFPNGTFEGTPEEGFEVGAVYLNA